MQPTKKLQSHLKERALYSLLGRLLMFGLLSKNHHNINLSVGKDLLLNEGAMPLL